MAAFPSFQNHHPFLHDSVFSALQNPPSTINSKVCCFLEESNNNATYFSQFSAETLLQNLDHSTNISDPTNNIKGSPLNSEANKNNMDNASSIITADHCHKQFQKASPMENKRKSKQLSSNSAQSKDTREAKGKKQKKIKDVEEKKEEKKEVSTGYIHVRARRGQATDSHSLAERVRRERISERMKLLQSIVPGCDKVTGKALMLDEIINYVQSLQNQVEFLSMKLASLNPMLYDFGMDLESLMISPDQDIISFPPQLQSMQQCNHTTTNNNYPLMDNSASSLILQQAQTSSEFSQGIRQVSWGVDDQRQKIFNLLGMNSNCLFPFH